LKVEPFQNRLFVRRLDDAAKVGNIVLPDGVGNKQTYIAEVIATGPGRRDFNGVLWPCASKPGDKVIFYRGGGTNVGMDHEKLTVITEDDVLGRVIDGESL
jgi:chaperonin GroES